MARLLVEIRLRHAEISLALSELGFIHFARFLPLPDQSALLVITEFDGPLEPYVMDFAIQLGDVFSLILSHVDGYTALPVKDHPDEFWKFIQRNNRVCVPGLPIPEDYPLFSAYPQRTVLEITGPRRQLPPPALDRAAAPIDSADVQGNILLPYNAEVARHFFYQVTDPARARAWLASLAVTSAQPWGATKPDTMLNVGLTFAGLTALDIEPGLLADFPTAFIEGPAEPSRALANGDVGDSAPGHWRFGQPGVPIHLMLSLYGAAGKTPAFDAAAAAIGAWTPVDQGVDLVLQQDAKALSDNRDHFGYREGMGQPRIATPSCGGASPVDSADTDLQPAASPGEFLLGPDYQDIYGGPSIGKMPPALARNGSFCAVRMLAQDVQAFDQTLDDGASALGVSRELVAAKLLGRWFDGHPVSLYPDDEEIKKAPASQWRTNAFDYAPSYEFPANVDDHEGRRCPIGAHIRRANPRTSQATGVRYSRRLLRRGMPCELPATGSAVAEVGLFGLFFCGSLERQFEFIQQQWINGDIFSPGIRGTRDPIAGMLTPCGAFNLPGMAIDGGTATLTVPRLVTTRGSLYLFFPGLHALRHLDSAVPHTAALREAGPGILLDLAHAERWIQGILTKPVLEGMAESVIAPLPTGDASERASAAQRAGCGMESFDPHDRGFLANPYPTFARFRQTCPVRYVPEHDACWVFQYPQVEALLQDQRRFLKRPKGDSGPRGLFTMDPPRHLQVRAWLDTAFQQAMQGAQTQARTQAVAAADDIARMPAGCFDFVEHFGRRVPREVFFDVLGVPPADRAHIDRLARTVMMHADHTLDPLQRLIGKLAAVQLILALGLLMARALFQGGFQGTLLHEIAKITLPGTHKLTVIEAGMTLLQFTLGGYLSMEFLLCTGTRNLLLDGGRDWRDVAQQPSLLPDAIEEMRRFDAPLGVIERFAADDQTLGGVDLKAGDRLIGLIGSANHDPTVFGASSEIFDIRRATPTSGQTQLALGRGPHACIGLPLQAQVLPLAFETLLARFPGLRLASNAQPPWLSDPYFRSFTQLMVMR
ncbi:cytochrome P450 [Variovorax sp. LT1R16]|uniref:cytochrome P450 n=1 Tax=Variovorax sp. LT1R16 TaxID=3443728 RepID=UPI003F457616